MIRWRNVLFWLEILGLLPTTVFFGPLLCVGLFAMVLVLLEDLFDSTVPPSVGLTGMGGAFLLLLFILAATLGLAAAWVTLLGGMRSVRRSARLRWPVRISLLLGLSSSTAWLVWLLVSSSNFQGRNLWFSLLPPAMLVGGHQLYGLMRTTA